MEKVFGNSDARNRRIIRLHTLGHSYKNIAAKVGLSVARVQFIVYRWMRKGKPDPGEAFTCAQCGGIFPTSRVGYEGPADRNSSACSPSVPWTTICDQCEPPGQM